MVQAVYSQPFTCTTTVDPINLTGGPVQGLIDGAVFYEF